jgi:hypothetical protein
MCRGLEGCKGCLGERKSAGNAQHQTEYAKSPHLHLVFFSSSHFSAGVICMGGGVFERQKKEEKEMEKEKFNKEL